MELVGLGTHESVLDNFRLMRSIAFTKIQARLSHNKADYFARLIRLVETSIVFFRNIHLISDIACAAGRPLLGQFQCGVAKVLALSTIKAMFILWVLPLSLFFTAFLGAQETERRPIYSKHTYSLIGEVAVDAPYQTISVGCAKSAQKKCVRFTQPTVKGWVSESYLNIDELTNTATVRADALNFRVGPRIQAPKITQVYQGHQSLLLDRRSGFAQIHAPISLEVLIDDESGDKAVRLAEEAATEVRPASKATEKVAEEFASVSDENKASDTQNNKVGVAETVVPERSLPEQNQVVNLLESKHRLAPGDSISLLVFGEPDLSAQNVRVPQSGRVSFPLIGSVAVLGKTTSEVEQDVAALLSQGYVRNPRLSVSIFSYRPIFIRGEVSSTGDYPYTEGLTIAKAIAIAGGTKESASENGVSITRDGVVVAQGLSINSQTLIASGDIVSVDADEEVKEAESAYIYLHGEVAQAGAYEFQSGLTVEKAIVLAGGFTLRASKKKINISRYSDAAEDGAPIELKRVKLYTPIKPGDVIKVGASWF